MELLERNGRIDAILLSLLHLRGEKVGALNCLVPQKRVKSTLKQTACFTAAAHVKDPRAAGNRRRVGEKVSPFFVTEISTHIPGGIASQQVKH